ncbi:MAG: TIGR03936 family radical SAM-associated protein [Planctomycetota bacterium]
MIRQRVRIRFRKEGDLRLIGHRDLVRTVERSLRRARVQLSMSEGFHPKARLSFPLALSVGVAGDDEVMEVDFAEEVEQEALTELLRSVFPPGLELKSLEVLPEGTPKAQVTRVVYHIEIPSELRETTTTAIQNLLEQEECWIERRNKKVDLKENLLAMEMVDGCLRLEQQTSRTAMAGPRDFLNYMGIGKIEHQGATITRTEVTLDAATT